MMGSPHSRQRAARIDSTLLGQDEGPVRCPLVLRVAIDFGRRRPSACAQAWLKAAGFRDEGQARAEIDLPPGPCACRVDGTIAPVAASALDPLEGLRLAMVLGLSTPYLYDRSRPLLWTDASLTRRLALFDVKGFYA